MFLEVLNRVTDSSAIAPSNTVRFATARSLKETLDLIGFFAPKILGLISVIQLWNRSTFLIGYILFWVGNNYLNQILKTIIKQPRPSGGRTIINEKYYGADIYGMPSSHAQSVFFSMIYLYLVKNSSGFLLLEMFISALALYQRWSYRKHTAEQLFAGSVIGFCMANIAYFATNKWLTTRNLS